MHALLVLANSLVAAASHCSAPLGLEAGTLPDDRFSASSSFQQDSTGPHRARLNSNAGGGAWCPRNLVAQDGQEFLEVDLGREHRVTGAVIQGRFANGVGQEFTEYFRVQYWRPELDAWTEYMSENGSHLQRGNTDTNSEIKVVFKPPLLATKVRIVPYSQHPRTVCLRLELLGCPVDRPKPVGDQIDRGYLAILAGALLTLALLLVVLAILLVRRRGRRLVKHPSTSNVSVSSSFLERSAEPLYCEPGLFPEEVYTTPISVIYSRPLGDGGKEVYRSPRHLAGSFTDISYLEESSVDSWSSSSSSGGTPRLPPLPSFDLPHHIYVNQSAAFNTSTPSTTRA